jgi:cytochrome c-type biogenesis protein CcmF
VWLIESGHLGVWCAFGLSVSVFAHVSVLYALRLTPSLAVASWLRGCFTGSTLCLCMGYFALTYAFLQDDFSTKLVWQNSYTTTPWWYKLTAVWGNHDGSWLLWSLLTSMQLSIALLNCRAASGTAIKLLVASGMMTSVLGYQLFFANPFLRLLPMPPPEGMDLNPLLQDTMFLVHPPLLYLGSTALCVVYLYAVSACWSKDVFASNHWPKAIYVWSLWSWSFLTAGIALGSYWAYHELGWGGWWFWDPVENLSLLPWFMATTLVHTRWRGSKVLDKYSIIFAALMACTMVVFGLFVVRSGLLVSVHSFSDQPEKSKYLLMLFVLTSAFSVISWLRLQWLHTVEKTRQVIKCIESTGGKRWKVDWLQVQATIFYLLHVWVLLATMYPWCSEVFLGQSVSVGHDYFHAFIGTIWLVMGFLMGLSAATRNNTRSMLMLSVISLFMTVCVAQWCHAYQKDFDRMLMGCVYVSMWVLSTHGWQLCTTQNARTLGHMVHMCVAFFALKAMMQGYHESHSHAPIAPGEEMRLQDEQLVFNGVSVIKGPNYTAKVATLTATLGSGKTITLHPEIRYFQSRSMATTKSVVHSAWLGDHYLVMTEPTVSNYQLRWYYKPYQRMIWISASFMVLFGVTLWLRAYRSHARTQAASVVADDWETKHALRA